MAISIPFFTDNNVPESVGQVLTAHGHSVVRLRDCIPEDSDDPLVAVTCAINGRVLISHDHDFKEVSRRLAMTQAHYRTRLHRIDMRCFEPDGAARIETALSLIEHEWAVANASDDGQMVIEIKD